MRLRSSWKIIAILVVALFLTFFDLPNSTQKKIAPFAPQSILDQKVRLGLDLQGGSQLDYKMALRKVPEKDRSAIVEGVFEVITKRVNGIGVSEPNIFQSTVGNEEHIIVELPGIKDLEEAKKTVGKTIQLEFKEQKEKLDPDEENKIKAQAEEILKKILKGADLAVVGQEEQQVNPGKVKFVETDFTFVSTLSKDTKDAIKKLKAGEIADELVKVSGAFTVDASTGQLREETSLDIIKLIEKKEEVRYDKQVGASHILIAYQGADRAPKDLTRTEDEAKKRAEEVLAKVKAGEDFEKLAKEFSDDPGSKDKGGKLDSPVNKDTSYVKELKDATLALEKAGDLSDVIKSPFGFHIIRADKVEKDVKEEKVKLSKISFSTVPDPWKETGLTGEHFTHADVQLDNLYQPYVSIQFNEEGAKLFEQITERNINKRLAIFVGGEFISAPRVNSKISGGQAQITGRFTPEEARKLARDLNTGAIPAPIVLAGQYTIGATLGQDALSKSIYAGLIGLISLAIFMILYYRFPGFLANVALTIYTVILLFLIKSSLPLWLSLLIGLAVFIALINKILKSDDPGWEKFLSFILAIIALFFVTFILNTPIVLTLAGIAGVILSIGMAVDANILIFERIKEELRDGQPILSAIETGFERAWSSIRDSNFSSLITCAILFYFGTSIIKGFAFNLAAGILVSMFTAVTISRTFIRAIAKTRWGSNPKLFGKARAKEKPSYKIIEKSKIWFTLSGVPLLLTIVLILTYGFKLGLDFTGGTLMQLNFENPVKQGDLKKALSEIQDKIATEKPAETEKAEMSKTGTELVAAEETIDLKNAQIISAGEKSYIVKTKFLSNITHDNVIKELKDKLGNFEESRFTTVGPTVGKTLKNKATMAVIIASIAIILYIAFAFRKVPKQVSPWRFGVCAVLALIHDVLLTVGLFVILGLTIGVEIDALFITALLTVMGFSVHDTIVVFDRIREKLRTREKDETLKDITNKALTETYARSINTSLSTLLTLASLLLLGSPVIFYFALALFFGIIVGTYSSIYIASPLLVAWSNYAENKK